MTNIDKFVRIIIGDTMFIRRISYFMLFLGMILIISGGFSLFLEGLQKDREAVVHRMSDVSTEFETFSTNVSHFGDYREDFHESVLENLYYDTMLSTDTFVKQELKKYEEMVDDIESSVSILDSLCEDVYYPEGDVNSMCMNYKSMYELVVNYFVLDVDDYNFNVGKFNDYQKSNLLNTFIREYSTTKKFIDYNNDGVFEGKEED